MTAPSTPNGKPAADRRRRRLALAAILTLIALAALFTPEVIGGRTGDTRLTTYSAEAQGAKLLYELASRLGWRVERWTDAVTMAADWTFAGAGVTGVSASVNGGASLACFFCSLMAFFSFGVCCGFFLFSFGG